jgi:hypothetical protein
VLDLTIAKTAGGVRALRRRLAYPDLLRFVRFYNEAIAKHGDGTIFGNGVAYLFLPQSELGRIAWRRNCLTGLVLHWIFQQAREKGFEIARFRTARVWIDGDVAEGTTAPLSVSADITGKGGEPFEFPPLDRIDVWINPLRHSVSQFPR